MNTNSNSYTIIYASVMVVIVAFLLAFVSSSLKAIQNKNQELDTKKQILAALNIRDVKDADAELLDQAKRYEKYAAAQAWLTDSSITLPTVSNGGSPMLQRTVPYSRAASWVGTKGTGTFYKYLEMSKDVVTTKDFNKAKEEWLKKKAESNKKAQEDLKDHIEKKK